MLAAAYGRELERHGYTVDAAQLAVLEHLEVLRAGLERESRSERGLVRGLRARLPRVRARAGVRGIYLWGGVGRGKTMLMDLFQSCLSVPARRLHFHRFMQDVHARLREHSALADPLAQVAADIAADCRVLCLDELFVRDIANAMILAGLLRGLFAGGVTLVVTSNLPPQELYKDGLQRQRFLPAIEVIERHVQVLGLEGGTDYRLRQLERAPLYISAQADDAESLLAQRFEAIAGQAGAAGGSVDVESRAIPVRRRAAGVIWFDFGALCDGPRSQADYIEIARSFHTVVLSGVPVFDAVSDNQARRFIALVDEFYDRGVKLVVSAEASPEALYRGELLAFEFERTTSRLHEMQTHAYLERPHRP